MKTMSFNQFCHKKLDGLYDPNFDYKEQCSGYKQLREMVANNIKPASREEIKRWEKHPTLEELTEIPKIKYMRNLHTLLRPVVIDNWHNIKNLQL